MSNRRQSAEAVWKRNWHTSMPNTRLEVPSLSLLVPFSAYRRVTAHSLLTNQTA
jgi:hypothetical protein